MLDARGGGINKQFPPKYLPLKHFVNIYHVYPYVRFLYFLDDAHMLDYISSFHPFIRISASILKHSHKTMP